MTGVFTYWPNRITAMRFVGAFILFALFVSFGERPANEIQSKIVLSFWLFVVVAATDFLDGWLARRGKHVTAFGRIADPFVDKILIVGTLVFLTVLPWSRVHLPAWMVRRRGRTRIPRDRDPWLRRKRRWRVPGRLVRQGQDDPAVLCDRGHLVDAWVCVARCLA